MVVVVVVVGVNGDDCEDAVLKSLPVFNWLVDSQVDEDFNSWMRCIYVRVFDGDAIGMVRNRYLVAYMFVNDLIFMCEFLDVILHNRLIMHQSCLSF